MPQKKVTLRTRKPRDGEIRHYVNTRLGDLVEATEIRTRTIVSEEIEVAVKGLEGLIAAGRELTDKKLHSLASAIATAHLGKVQIAEPGLKSRFPHIAAYQKFIDEIGIDARPPEPVFVPDTPYVLISIRHGRTDLAKTIGKVDVDIFDWDAVKQSIESNEDRLFSEREVEYLKEQDQSLYNKYMAQKYEASMGPAIVRAKLVENWLEEPDSAVLKALQQRGWVIKPYDK